MSELFTYGSVGGAGHNPGAKVPGEGPLLPGGHLVSISGHLCLHLESCPPTFALSA